MYIHIWKCQAFGTALDQWRLETSGYTFPSSFHRQESLRGSSMEWRLGVPVVISSVEFPWFDFLSVLVQPSQPLHSCHLGSLPKINYLLMFSSVLMLCVLGKPGRERRWCLCSWNCIPQTFLAPGSDGFSFFTMPSVARVAACYVLTVLEFDFLATAGLLSFIFLGGGSRCLLHLRIGNSLFKLSYRWSVCVSVTLGT